MRLLQTYAATKDKTITSLVEDWIDSLNSEKVCSSSLREALPTTNDPN
ncbi:hypothetical protein [Nostoc sp. XA010]|nr:hypothetical protein [Nostoc sp. XA010]